MPRFHNIDGVRVPFTPDEEATRDAEEAKELAEYPKRLWEGIKQKRNQLLKESDWIDLPNSTVNKNKKQEWLNYRQKLRDIPQKFKNSENIKWPEKTK